MSTPVLFSVITVTYNADKVLERTIQSVLGQTDRNQIEYIIVDGASKDKTIDIIRKYEAGIDYWVSEPDKGLYYAMNKGLTRAQGEYVWFINAGDEIYSQYVVEELSKLITQQKVIPDILYGETYIIDGQGESIGPRRLKSPKKLSWTDFKWGMLVSHQSFIVRSASVIPFDTSWRYVADYEWCIKSLKRALVILNTDIILSKYMEEGLSTLHRKASLKERFRVMKNNYGTITVYILHLWFAIRFYISKLVFGRV